MDWYSHSAHSAIVDGRPAKEGMQAAAAELTDFIKKKDQYLADDLGATLARVAAHPSLTDDVRERLAALWEFYGEMKGGLDSFRGTLEAFDGRTRTWAEKHRQLVSFLRARLDISDED
jgi:hypothetical protein